MTYTVRARGRGRAELPAYGLGDAEHQVEKEIHAAWPDARVDVAEVLRMEAAGRIVEEFAVSYRVEARLALEADSADAARREALRRLRAAFGGTRHRRMEWTEVECVSAG